MTVICPWCEKEKTFTRPGDLQTHCKQRHLIETNGYAKTFFSTRNCFYFSIYPEDYVKINNIESWTSADAVEARRLVMKWTEQQPDSFIKKENWRQGWRTGMKSKLSESNKENEMFVAVKLDPLKEVTQNANDENIMSQKMSKSEVNEAYMKEIENDLTYDPETQKRKEKKTVRFVATNEPKEKRVKETKKETEPNKNTETTKITTETNESTDATRTETELNETTNTTKTDTELNKRTETESESIKSNDNIEKTPEQEEPLDYSKTPNSKNIKAIEKDEETRIEGNEAAMNLTLILNKERNDLEIEKKDKDENNENDLDITNIGKETEGGQTPLQDEREIEEELSGEIELMKEIENVKKRKAEESKERRVKLVKTSEGIWKREVETAEKGKRDPYSEKECIVLKVRERPKIHDKNKNTEIEKSYNMNNTTEIKKNTHNNTEIDTNNNNIEIQSFESIFPPSFAERAIGLLMTGVMPLCPPGRRDWDQAETYKLTLKTIFVWPPNNWRLMSADRKLLAWEFAAMSLERMTQGEIDPATSRTYLLDKYNFLALPGTAKQKKESGEEAVSRVRYYSYQVLREIAGGKKPSIAEVMHLESLEKIWKMNPLDLFHLQDLRVPLRLSI